jgi:hypothetical protein
MRVPLFPPPESLSPLVRAMGKTLSADVAALPAPHQPARFEPQPAAVPVQRHRMARSSAAQPPPVVVRHVEEPARLHWNFWLSPFMHEDSGDRTRGQLPSTRIGAGFRFPRCRKSRPRPGPGNGDGCFRRTSVDIAALPVPASSSHAPSRHSRWRAAADLSAHGSPAPRTGQEQSPLLFDSQQL